jgi:hypothetical protein
MKVCPNQYREKRNVSSQIKLATETQNLARSWREFIALRFISRTSASIGLCFSVSGTSRCPRQLGAFGDAKSCVSTSVASSHR